jgi:hypothetical protein
MGGSGSHDLSNNFLNDPLSIQIADVERNFTAQIGPITLFFFLNALYILCTIKQSFEKGQSSRIATIIHSYRSGISSSHSGNIIRIIIELNKKEKQSKE